MEIVKTFIFVHDADIINACIEKQRFAKLPNVKYVFLGHEDTSAISNPDDCIIARNLPHNIEQYNYLCAWTGWYAIFKNNFVEEGDIVNLFEYDIAVIDNFTQNDECAYFSCYSTDEIWWNFANIQIYLEKLLGFSRRDFCGQNVPVTSNYTFTYRESLIEPIQKIINLGYAENKYIGHIIERFYSYLHRDIKFSSQLNHLKADSHNTQHKSYNKQKVLSWL